MDETEKISSAWQRSVRGLSRRPELGKVTHSVTARITEGLTCAVEAEGHRLVADQPEIARGNSRGCRPRCTWRPRWHRAWPSATDSDSPRPACPSAPSR